MKQFTNNGVLFMLAPAFLIASDFIATKFSASKAATQITSNKGGSIFMNHVYGSKFYNTSFKRFPDPNNSSNGKW